MCDNDRTIKSYGQELEHFENMIKVESFCFVFHEHANEKSMGSVIDHLNKTPMKIRTCLDM